VLSFVKIGGNIMKIDEAVANIFMTAFKTLGSREQRAILSKILKMRQWRKDLLDIAIAESRNQEKSRSFRTFLAEIEK